MDKITCIAEEILRLAANDGGGNLYPAQLNVSMEDFAAAMKLLSPFGQEIIGNMNGASPIFQINDFGKAFVAQGMWSEKEKREALEMERHQECVNLSNKSIELAIKNNKYVICGIIVSIIGVIISILINKNII